MPIPIGQILKRVKLAINGEMQVRFDGGDRYIPAATHIGKIDVSALSQAAKDLNVSIPIDLVVDPDKPGQYLVEPVKRLISSMEKMVGKMVGESGTIPAASDQIQAMHTAAQMGMAPKIPAEQDPPGDEPQPVKTLRETNNFHGKPEKPVFQFEPTPPERLELMGWKGLLTELKRRDLKKPRTDSKSMVIARIEAYDQAMASKANADETLETATMK
jgi:hypothetical protein